MSKTTMMGRSVLALAAATALALTATPVSTAAPSDGVAQAAPSAQFIHDEYMGEGESLAPGEAMYAPKFQQRVTLTKDGVLAKQHLKWYFLWITDWTIDASGADKVVMQRDGNLVMYKGKKALWASKTVKKDGAGEAAATITDAGDFLIQHGDTVVWKNGDKVKPAPSYTNVLQAGEKLVPGGKLVSENGDFRFVYQKDGNLVVYRAEDNKALWNARTAKKESTRLVMQGDGNLVLYNGKKAVWNSKTRNTNAKKPRLVMRNNGNLVIVHGDTIVWRNGKAVDVKPDTTNVLKAGEKLVPGGKLVSENGDFRFVYQKDGNLVVYRAEDNKALWNARTAKKESTRLVMQGDGNLVLYNGNSAVWQSKTNATGVSNARLLMRNNGNLVVVHGDSTIVWRNGELVDGGEPTPTPTASPTTPGDDVPADAIRYLAGGKAMHKGDILVSYNKAYKFVYQHDGNLVVYRLSDNKATWQAKLAGVESDRLVMQTDGNAVLYDGNKAVWQTRTAGSDVGTVYLVILNGGELVVTHSGNQIVWSSENH